MKHFPAFQPLGERKMLTRAQRAKFFESTRPLLTFDKRRLAPRRPDDGKGCAVLRKRARVRVLCSGRWTADPSWCTHCPCPCLSFSESGARRGTCAAYEHHLMHKLVFVTRAPCWIRDRSAPASSLFAHGFDLRPVSARREYHQMRLQQTYYCNEAWRGDASGVAAVSEEHTCRRVPSRSGGLIEIRLG